MPDPAPEPLHRLTASGEFERVVDPTVRLLDALILALRAIHPAEWHLLECERAAGRLIPHRCDVGEARAKPVAIGEPSGGIVDEARVAHGALGRADDAAQEVLSHSTHSRRRDRLESGPLLSEPRSIEHGLEAAVQPDLMPVGE